MFSIPSSAIEKGATVSQNGHTASIGRKPSIYIYTYIYIYTHTYIHTYMHAHMSVYEFTLDVRCRAQALNRVTKSKQ